jgi:hypothetical protein
MEPHTIKVLVVLVGIGIRIEPTNGLYLRAKHKGNKVHAYVYGANEIRVHDRGVSDLKA